MDRLKRFSRKKRFEKWLWLAKVGDVRTVDGTKVGDVRTVDGTPPSDKQFPFCVLSSKRIAET